MSTYQQFILIMAIASLWLLFLIVLGVYGTLKHWDWKKTLKMGLPISILFLIVSMVILRLPWWLIVVLSVAATIASIGYVKGTIELGQFIRERLFRR